MGDSNATKITNRPAYQLHARQRGTGLAGWSRATARTPSQYASHNPSSGSTTCGSICHARSTSAADAGTGATPCAATAPGHAITAQPKRGQQCCRAQHDYRSHTYYVDAPAQNPAKGTLLTLLGSRTRPNLLRAARVAVHVGLGIAVLLLAAACVSVTSDPRASDRARAASGAFPPAAVTQQASETGTLYAITFAIAAIVFVLVEGLLILIVAALPPQARPTRSCPTRRHGSNPLEILWTIIPAITVTVLFVGRHRHAQQAGSVVAATRHVTVDVTGFQWQWTFDYHDQGT